MSSASRANAGALDGFHRDMGLISPSHSELRLVIAAMVSHESVLISRLTTTPAPPSAPALDRHRASRRSASRA